MNDPGEITVLLQRLANGDRSVEAELYEKMYPRLRKVAALCLRNERRDRDHTLQKTALIHECYIKAVRQKKPTDWRNAGHFLAISTRMMRQILTDYARWKGPAVLLPLDEIPEALLKGRNWVSLSPALEAYLDELEKESPIMHNVLVFRAFMGCSTKETAELLGITDNVVEHKFHLAKRWLFTKLSEGACKTGKSG